MKTKKQFCILYYIDEGKKTFNPGLILSSPDVEDEISRITFKLRARGRRVRIFTAHLVDDIEQLPLLNEPVGNGLSGYTYDPWLFW